jgi:Family of unknown function (DUF5317)
LYAFALAAGLFFVQQIAIRRIGVDGYAGGLRRTLFFVTTVILIGLALHYRRYVGAWLIAAGIGLNLMPITAYGGLMPVSYRVVRESGIFPEITEADIGQQLGNGKDILLRDDQIQFSALSDRYYLAIPVYGGNIYSLGDFVLFGGVAVVVLQAAAAGVAASTSHRSRPVTVPGP